MQLLGQGHVVVLAVAGLLVRGFRMRSEGLFWGSRVHVGF